MPRKAAGKYNFIVLEGVDGTGKTTQASSLAEAIGGKNLSSPPEPFDSKKQEVLQTAAPWARFMYFLASNLQVSSITDLFRENTHVVCDRYIWSTLAYHVAIERIDPIALQERIMPIIDLLTMPDIVIFLTVDRGIQLDRLHGRYENSLQLKLLKSDEFQKQLRGAYLAFRDLMDVRWIEVDTSSKSVTTVTKEILRGITRTPLHNSE